MKKFFEGLKKMSEGGNRKKLIENAVIVVVIGIIILIASSSFFGKDKNSEKNPNINDTAGNTQQVSRSVSPDEYSEAEEKLSAILSKISGAGKVDVMITYISSKESILAADTKTSENDTQEKDTGGGTRNITQDDSENSTVFEQSQGGTKKPVVVKELQPQVKGVVVVAEGASESTVKESLCRAVQVLMDIPIHKIQVFERNK